MNLTTVEIKAFVPANNLEQSKAFYSALGFNIPWSSDDLAYVHYGSTSFLLQQCATVGFAGNFMMHLLVEKVDDWYQHVLDANVHKKFDVRLEAPADRPWGIRDFPLTDPAGVLWRIGQNIPASGNNA
jgi:hypothetical protein